MSRHFVFLDSFVIFYILLYLSQIFNTFAVFISINLPFYGNYDIIILYSLYVGGKKTMNTNFDQLAIRFQKLNQMEPLSPAVLAFIRDLLICLDATEKNLAQARKKAITSEKSSDEEYELLVRYAAEMIFRAGQQILSLEGEVADADERLRAVEAELDEARRLATLYHDQYFNLLERS